MLRIHINNKEYKSLANYISLGEKNKINKNAIQLIKSKEREDAIKFMKLTEYIDLIVPRGGKGLIDTLVENAKVPFILDGDGNVHLYVHEDANTEYVIDIIINSKVQRPGVCNALETLILNKSIDAVLICSPTNLHFKQIMFAAKHNKDIFCAVDHGFIGSCHVN